MKWSKNIPFEKQFESYKQDKMGRNEFYLGETSEYLQAADMDALPVVMPQKVVDKAQRAPSLDRHGHKITDDVILELPELIKKPLMVFYSETAAENGIEGRVLVCKKTVKGENGMRSPLFVAIHLNRKQGFQEVNRIATVFGKDTNPYDYIIEQTLRGNLLAYSKKEAEKLLHSVRRQLPKENTAFDFDTRIPHNDNSVNTQSMQNLQNDASSNKKSVTGTENILFESEAEKAQYVSDSFNLSGAENYKTEGSMERMSSIANSIALKWVCIICGKRV